MKEKKKLFVADGYLCEMAEVVDRGEVIEGVVLALQRKSWRGRKPEWLKFSEDFWKA